MKARGTILPALLILAAAGVAVVVFVRSPDATGLAPRGAGAPAGASAADDLARAERGERTSAEDGSQARVQEDAREASPAIEPAEEPAITGRVVDSEGAPVAGAELIAAPDEEASFNTFDGDVERSRTDELEDDLTDAEGRFRLEVLEWRLYTVSASAPGYASVEREACQAGQSLELVLRRAASLTGFVTREDDDSPVAGALVRVFHGPGREREDSGTTDARGRYAIGGLVPGVAGVQVIPVEEATPNMDEVELVAGGETRHDLRVSAGWVLTGQVRDARTGVPIAGAEVSAWRFFQKNVRTDAGGLYRLPGVRARGGTLSARAPGYGRGEVAFASADEPLDIELQPGLRIFGRVLDRSGYPCEARVSACASERVGDLPRGEWATAFSRGNGEFELLDVRRDLELVLFVRSTEYASLIHPVPRASPETAEVDLGDLVLDAGARVAGRVLSAGGSPLERVLVDLRGPAGDRLPGSLETYVRMRQTRTDVRGIFRIADLAAGDYRVRLVRPDGAVLEKALVLAAGEHRRDLEWSFPPGGRLSGIVVGPDGAPVPRASVTLLPDGVPGAPARTSVSSDERGEFAFEDVLVGTFLLQVLPPTAEDDSAPLAQTVLRGIVPDGSYVEVRLARADAWIEGVVADADGAPVPLALVSIERGEGWRWEGVLADEQGRFRLRVPGTAASTLHAWRTAKLESGGGNMTVLEWKLQRRILRPSTPDGVLLDVAPGTLDARIRL